MADPRRRSRYALATLASLILLLAVVVGYGQRVVGNSEQFADRATDTLNDASVRSLLASRITDGLVIAREADLIAARPLIGSTVEGVLEGRAFTSLFRGSVDDLHRAVFTGSQDTVTLTLFDVGTVVAEALRKVRPELAEQLPSQQQVRIATKSFGAATAEVSRTVEKLRILAWVLGGIYLVVLAGALWRITDRRSTVVAFGVGMIAIGLFTVVALAIGRTIVLGQLDAGDARTAGAAIWNAFLADLRRLCWLLMGIGAVVTAAATTGVHPVPLGDPLKRLSTAIKAEPRTPPLAVLRAVLLIVVGIFVIVDRDDTIVIVLTLLGVYLIYEGARLLLWLSSPRIDRPASFQTEVESRPRRRAVPTLIAMGTIAAAVTTFGAAGGVSAPSLLPTVCNGSRSLCDKPLNDVAFAMTHNAMSAPLPGWFSAEQDAAVPEQLADGVRGLMLDTYYADLLPNGRARTFFASSEDLEKAGAELSPESVAAAERLRNRIGFSGTGKRGIFFCHGFCELGFTPISKLLGWIRTFMVNNPDEVIVIIHQDQISPADFVQAVDDAGLGELAYAGPLTGTWPTLGKMIESGQRLVILDEHESGGARWNRLAYAQALQETPFSFTSTSQLTDSSKLLASCEPNRGPQTAPLFLVNHWVNRPPAPRPSQAAVVNAYEPMMERIRVCSGLRKQKVNFIGVNFYRRGDVFRVVDSLNGVRRPRH